MAQRQEEMRSIETIFRQIVDSIPVPVAVTTPAGEVEALNQATLEYFGRTFEDLKGWKTSDAVHPEDLQETIDAFTTAHETGRPYHVESRHLRSDGIYRWFNVIGLPLRDVQGSIIRWFHLQIDIEDRKRAEDAVRESERNLTQVINTIPALAWSARADGSVEFFNQHYLDFVGISQESAKDWDWRTAVHPDDREVLAAEWQSMMAMEEAGGAEARLRRHDGQYRWFLFRANPLRDDRGKVLKWYGINTDIDDQKRVEDDLRRSEARKTAILNSALDCIISIDDEGRITEFNPAAERTFGHSRSDVVGELLADVIVPPYLRDQHRKGLGRYLATGERRVLGKRMETIAVRANGSEFPVELAITQVDSDGPPFFTGYLRDITARKASVAKLQANQDLLDLAQKSAGAMAFDWHIRDDVNIWSVEQEALYGIPPGSFDGTYEGWKKLIYPPDWPGIVESIKHAHETGDVAAEFRVVWPDSSVHWLATKGRMFFDDKGEPLRMVGFTSDITRRKLVEEELRRSEAFLAEGQHLARLGNFSWCVATEEITWSEQLYRIFEFEPGTLITLDLIASRVHPEDIEMLYEMAEAAGRGVSNFEYEHRLVMPDGSTKHLHLIAHKSGNDREPLEYIGAVQDVTQRRHSEEALSKARSELTHAFRAMSLGVLTASIAHEVNQPLSGIITNANTCVRMLDAEPPNIDGARETARRTIRDGNRASDVIKKLRALFGKKEFVPEQLDLNQVAQEVIALTRTELQKSQVVLRTKFAKNLPRVDGDRVQLQQVILNLILNAADAMSNVRDGQRQLTVTTRLEGNASVRLEVRDRGVGFAADEAERLFDPFYTTKKNGMGIGLSVSRSIIESHHGKLWAVSNDGPGSEFCFLIPIQNKSGGVQTSTKTKT